MFGRWNHRIWARASLALLLAGISVPVLVHAQGFEDSVPARARVFSAITSGVTAMKRDSAGRFYILASPPNVISIFSPEGARIGQIPGVAQRNSVGSSGAGSSGEGSASPQIRYAVDFDLDPDGRVIVADRGANAIEIFSPDGTLVARMPFFAPTSVVALAEGEFAVTTLRPGHLVQILDSTGKVVRSFGDPADAGVDADTRSKELQILGKISGDGLGHIYYSFASLPDPTVRKYDRYGYVASEAAYPENLYHKPSAPAPDDRVQFGFNFSQANFSERYDTWATIGNRGDILFGGGVSPGLGAHLGGGLQTAQSASQSFLSTASGPGPNGTMGSGMLSAQGSLQGGDNLLFHLGAKPPRNSSTSASGSDANGQDCFSGSILQFDSSDSSASSYSGSTDCDISAQEIIDMDQPAGTGSNSEFGGSGRGGRMGGGSGGILGGMGAETFGGGLFPGLGGFGGFRGLGGGYFANSVSEPGQTLIPGALGSFGSGLGSHGIGSSGAGFGGDRGGMGEFGHFGEGRYGGTHGRLGEGLYNFTASVKVNLDKDTSARDDKPVVTAVGVDPVSQDIWMGVGQALVHFDKNGSYLADYHITTPEGSPIRSSAIVVEPDRIIISSSTRGIYEFPRFDKSNSPSGVRDNVLPAPDPARQ